MSKLPNYVVPFEDELLYSWVHRLAVANGLSFTEFIHTYCGIPASRTISAGMICELLPLYQFLRSPEDVDTLFLSLTTMNFEMISKTPLSQVRYFNSAFQPYSALNPNSRSLVPSVRICPECSKEDTARFGQPYIHRSHQLSGTCVCWKHHVKLMEYHGTKRHEMDFDMSGYEECDVQVSIEDAAAYAQYSHALLKANIQTDALSVRDAIFKCMEKQGFDTSDLVGSFLPSFQKWDHGGLTTPLDYKFFLSQTMHRTRFDTCHMPTLVPVLMYLWPDPKDFADAVSDHEPYLMRYTCPICGRSYYETPESQRDGWGCPYCAEKKPVEDRFEHLVDVMSNGEYEVLTPFKSLGEKVTMRHSVCGREFEISPSSFLFHGHGCPCSNHNDTERRAREFVESLPGGFKLLEYHGYHKPAKFLCETCGRTFEYNYIDFKASKRCRYCDNDPKTMKEFADRVKDLVGNEYKVIRRDPDDPDKVIMLHKKCGHEFSVYMHTFLIGSRCVYCSNKTSRDDLPELLDEYSKGRYSIVNKVGPGGDYIIHDAMHDRTIKMASRLIRQEVNRPTPSAKLPLDPEWDDTHWIPIWETKRQNIICRLSKSCLKDVIYDMEDDLSRWLRNQLRKWTHGKLSDERIALLEAVDPQMKDFIPFGRDQDELNWMQNFDIYCQYSLAREKGTERSKDIKKSIEPWKYGQREKSRDGQLSTYHHDKLLAIDPHFFDARGKRKENKS